MHNKRMKLTGAAILASRGMTFLQAAPAAYPYRSAAGNKPLTKSDWFTRLEEMLATASDESAQRFSAACCRRAWDYRLHG
jgi:hypothetical protein